MPQEFVTLFSNKLPFDPKEFGRTIEEFKQTAKHVRGNLSTPQPTKRSTPKDTPLSAAQKPERQLTQPQSGGKDTRSAGKRGSVKRNAGNPATPEPMGIGSTALKRRRSQLIKQFYSSLNEAKSRFGVGIVVEQIGEIYHSLAEGGSEPLLAARWTKGDDACGWSKDECMAVQANTPNWSHSFP